MSMVKALIVATLVFNVAGCSSFGPDYLRDTQPLYNDAIVDSTNQQYLQNLVRLHYRDPTFFLDVANIAATTKLSLEGSAGFHNNSGSYPANVGGGIMYDVTPTITYSPLQGEDFVRSMLSPIPLMSLFALTRSGWSVHRVIGLCVEKINGLDNAPTASGPKPEYAPEDIERWERMSAIIEAVNHKNIIQTRENTDTHEPELVINPTPEYQEAISELKQLLGLDPRRSVYKIKGGYGMDYRDTLYISTRSINSIYFYLSHRIDTPPEHVESGFVNLTHTSDGRVFDWGQTAAGRLFHMHQSPDRPEKAMLATYYRDYWFYIPDYDLESKSTFLLLTQLFRLQAGAAKGTIPALTIPVR